MVVYLHVYVGEVLCGNILMVGKLVVNWMGEVVSHNVLG